MTKRKNQALSLLILFNFIFASTPASFVFADTTNPPELTEPTEAANTDPPAEEEPTEEPEQEAEEELPTDDSKNATDESDESKEETQEDNTNEGEEKDETTTDETSTEEQPIAAASDTESNPIEVETTTVPADNSDDTANEPVEEKDTYVETGVTYAALNIVNILNSNIVNSNGLILFLSNLFNTQKQLLDMRDYGFLSDSEYDGSCEEETVCGSDRLTIGNTNDSNIVNDVYVSATSGSNQVDSNGNGEINTGDAYASANLINIANTNIVDSDYLILTFSSFGDWNGDVVFPGASALASLFGGGASYSNVDIENNNTATIINNTDVGANTGDNSASSESGEAAINTGNGSANTGVLNKINSNIFGTGNFSVIFRVHGDWLGDIFSLPEGISYEKNSSGLTLLNLSGSFDSPIDSLVTDSVVIKNQNDTNIENNLIVTAVSGQNSIEAEGDAVINTGNSYASANITNIANTNIVGKNWILAIIDIFGNWNGNVSFGRPDLWVGEQITTDGQVTNGSTVTYTYTLMNNGDTKATNLRITDSIDDRYIDFVSSSHQATVNGNSIVWNIDSLSPGEVKEISYTAKIKNAPYGETEITNSVTVSAHEPDENTADNTDTASVISYVRPPSRKSQIIKLESEAQTVLPLVSIESTNNAPTVITEETAVTYNIKLTNNSGSKISNTVLTDNLTGPNGDIIHTEIFELSEVEPGEIVIVEYTVIYNNSFKTGVYTNYSSATYLDSSSKATTTDNAFSRVSFISSVLPRINEPSFGGQINNDDLNIERRPPLRLIPTAEAADIYSTSDNSELLASVARFRTNMAFGSTMAIILLLIAYEISRRVERRH